MVRGPGSNADIPCEISFVERVCRTQGAGAQKAFEFLGYQHWPVRPPSQRKQDLEET
jgi:hypothetical protein